MSLLLASYGLVR